MQNQERNSSVAEAIRTNLGQKDLEFYKTCYLFNARFTKTMHRIGSQKNDGCVLFNLGGQPAIGFIMDIIRMNNGKVLFRINQVSIQYQLNIKLNNKRVSCPNIWKGDLDSSNSFVYVQPKSIVEKLVHVYDKHCKCYFFFRIPNLCESS